MGACTSNCNKTADKALESIDPPVAETPQEPQFTIDLSEPPVDVGAPLDERDIALVQQTWAQAALLGVEAVGVVLFTNIFEIAPEAKDLFPFKVETNVLHSPVLKAHGVKVVTTIATAVSLLGDLDTLVPVLQSLGLRHMGYKVLPAHYDVVGEALINTLSTALGINMTPTVTNAYLKVYTIIKDTMVGACDYKSVEEVAAQPEEPLFTVDLNDPPVDVSAPLDERDIALVQQTWAKAALLGVETVGVVLFTNIFEIAPEAKALFPFKDEPDLANSPVLKAHGAKVVSTIATAVSLLGDLGTLVPVLQSLGLRHMGYKVVPAHYDVVGQALIKSLVTALGSSMTPTVTNAYLKVYTIIKNTMVGACDYNKVQDEVKEGEKKESGEDPQKSKKTVPASKSKPKKKRDDGAVKKTKADEKAAPAQVAGSENKAAEETQAKEGPSLEEQLLAAAEAGDDKTIAKVLKASARVNTVDANGKAAIHFAAEKGWEEIVGRLSANKKIKINLQTTGSKDTALHLACQGGHKDCVVLIVRGGADTKIKNKAGKLAQELSKDSQLTTWLAGNNPAGTTPPWQGKKM